MRIAEESYDFRIFRYSRKIRASSVPLTVGYSDPPVLADLEDTLQ